MSSFLPQQLWHNSVESKTDRKEAPEIAALTILLEKTHFETDYKNLHLSVHDQLWPVDDPSTVEVLIGYWLYILPAGSPGSYSLSHTGDAYLGLHSLNGEGLNIAPSLQSQVHTEDSCSVDLSTIDPGTQNPQMLTPSLAPYDLNLSSDPALTLPLTPSTPQHIHAL